MNDYTIGSDRASITGVASIPVFFQRLATSTPFLESSSISARASSESRSCSIRPPPSLSWTLKESRILPRLRHSVNATFEKLIIIPLGRLIRFSFIHGFCRLGIYSATAISSEEFSAGPRLFPGGRQGIGNPTALQGRTVFPHHQSRTGVGAWKLDLFLNFSSLLDSQGDADATRYS